MFGYIEPEKGELRLREYEKYRALYCGLCRSMGRHTGQLSRFSLNYDYVFLAIVRTALEGEKPEFKPCRCLVHPLRKRAMVPDGKVLEYCSGVSALLTHFKISDNIADSRKIAKIAYSSLRPLSNAALNRANIIDGLKERVSEKFELMSELEKKNTSTPDSLAEVFGSIMSEIFSFGLEDESCERIAREIGRHTGRYIYISDALDDAKRDAETGNFNPFLLVYGKEELAKHTEQIKTAVLLELKQLASALELADFSVCPEYGEIARNIVYLGMPGRIGKILKTTLYTGKSETAEHRN